MAELLIKYPDERSDVFNLGSLRITIGRSARNDVCIADPFSSRVHAEIRREGDHYILQDLGSSNGTFYNNERLTKPVRLTHGGKIRIGETTLEYRERAVSRELTSTIVADPTGHLPATTISLAGQHTTSGLLEAIESARTLSSGRNSGKFAAAAKTATVAERERSAEQADLLALISKVGVTLLASATLDETLQQVAALVFEAVPAERCLIMLREADGVDTLTGSLGAHLGRVEIKPHEELKVKVARVRGADENVGEVRISRKVIEEVVGQGRSVLTSDAQHDPRYMSSTMTLQGIRSVLAVPLGVGSRIFGMIYADSPLVETTFNEDHLKVLTTLGSVAAIRVENARLLEQQFARERMERELQLAREIQQRFQPMSAPKIEGYELQGISFACYEIGGDYYDFIKRCNDNVVITLGDVSGKGTGAALLMSSLHAAIHAQCDTHEKISDAVRAVNDYLAENTPANRFVTLFYAELNPKTNDLRYINAGHNPPLLARAAGGTIEQLASSGLPLGIIPNTTYQEGSTTLAPGDLLVIYSDGVSETQNPQGEEFGLQRLADVITRNINETAARVRDRIEDALTKFAQGTPSVDDITMVIVKRMKD
jgi:sigma-B regulation protein RsbU (phosphoserine phosphatase)